MQIILASGSPYRQQLLKQLGLSFTTQSPNIDESQQQNEAAEQLVARLAKEKALAVDASANCLVIGSDQVGILDGDILTKPGSHAKAAQQLQQASGRSVTFLTSLCLLNTNNNQRREAIVPFTVKFRQLSSQEIEAYLHKEEPYECAGSFKMEGLGIALFESLQGDDPNSLIGLPLIKLNEFLLAEGFNVLTKNKS